MYNFLWLKKAKSYALIIIRLEDFINENMSLMLNSWIILIFRNVDIKQKLFSLYTYAHT